MKQQVFFMKGGIPKENSTSCQYYLKTLYNYIGSLFSSGESLSIKNRKDNLGVNLGGDYEYNIIPFQNRYFADYDSWKITFEEQVTFMSKDVIFIATSLGGSFICKYLSENRLNINIKKLIMLAPAFYDSSHEVLGSFMSDPSKFKNINSQCTDITIYHSTDDEIVYFSDSEEYLKLFPNATFRKFTDKGHFFNELRLLQLEEDIKN